MEISARITTNPFFSICIPQYNRTSFLIEACKVLAVQTFKDFEVCISDDRSTDGREDDLINYLRSSGLSFVYKKQEINLRYDGNIRGSITLAQGRYCFLHGNDDCLASDTTLADLFEVIKANNFPAVITSNFEDWETGSLHRRIRATQLIGHGPEVAATHFRNVAFVTGVLINCEQAQACVTDRWDGSEMYQMYVTSRIIASGGNLLELDKSVARKDIQIPGEFVDSYCKPRLNPCPIVERKLPMAQIGPLVADAISPYTRDYCRNKLIEKIFLQLYLFTYPFWFVEYRRIQSWKYSLGVCWGLKPQNTFLNLGLGFVSKMKLYLVYAIVCAVGLAVPIRIFNSIIPLAYRISKSLFSRLIPARIISQVTQG